MPAVLCHYGGSQGTMVVPPQARRFVPGTIVDLAWPGGQRWPARVLQDDDDAMAPRHVHVLWLTRSPQDEAASSL